MILLMGLLFLLILFSFFLAIMLLSGLKKREAGHELEEKVSAISNELEIIKSILSERISDINSRLDVHLGRTGAVMGDVKQSLGRIEEMARSVRELAASIVSLQDLLKPPSVRGGLGETMLERIIEEVLPEGFYSFQHRLPNGMRVDAAIFINNRILPLDAKFPLENFRKMLGSDGAEREKFKRMFLTDIRKHIDDIHRRYVHPDMGTFDFAVMYVPAESVYYEAFIVNHAVYDYAISKKVIPVSPGTFYAYLQAILYGIKGVQIEKHIEKVLSEMEGLTNSLVSLQKELDTLGEHIRRSYNKYESVRRNYVDVLDKAQKLSKRGGESL